MKGFIRYCKWWVAVVLLFSIFYQSAQRAEAANRPLSSASPGEVVRFSGKEWILLDPSTGYLISRYSEGNRPFDSDESDGYDFSDASENIGYWLNYDYYNGLSNKNWLISHSWGIYNHLDEQKAIYPGYVGLISYSEWNQYRGILGKPSSNLWTRTLGPVGIWAVESYDGSLAWYSARYSYSIRPAIYLQPGLFLDSSGQVTDVNYELHTNLTAPLDNQVFSATAGKDVILISGTSKGDSGISYAVKYTIDGVASYTDQTITTLVTDGTDQAYSANIQLDADLPEGTYTLRIWNETNEGRKFSETIRTIVVGSNNANLDGLSLSDGTLSPAFSPSNTGYTASVGNEVASLRVNPVVANAKASVKVNGGQPGDAVSLQTGPNLITIQVTAQDGTPKEYTITVTRALSSNANLSGLILSAGTLSPSFNQARDQYTASVPYAVDSLTVTPTLADGTATLKVNNVSAISGQASGAIALTVGANEIKISVTAQNGTPKTYTINVVRGAPSGNNNLSSLGLSSGSFSPAFTPGTTNYTATVGYAVANVKVTPVLADATATVQVNGSVVESGQASKAIGLSTGSNHLTLIVTAQNGDTKSYEMLVTRLNGDENLSSLKINGAGVTGFAPGTLSYSATVPNAVTSVTVTGTAADAKASVSVTGGSNLIVGDNAVKVTVTAEDPSITKDYLITVRRQAANADLSGLSLLEGTLGQAFDKATTAYSVEVPNAVTSVTVAGTAADAKASVSVTGSSNLNVGDNTVKVTVTAEDSSITKDYIITVRRLAGNADLSGLEVDNSAVSGFAPGNLVYSLKVPNATTSITVTGTPADGSASVSVTGGSNLIVGNNTVKVTVTAEDPSITKDYLITVRRQAANADLSALFLDGTSVAEFAPGTSSYSATVPNAVTAVTVTGTAADTQADVSVTGGSNLIVGDNTVKVTVAAEDPSITKDYLITVRRQAANADLSAMLLDGTGVAGFDPGALNYSATVPNAVTSVAVTGTAADVNAVVSVTGGSILIVGDNAVKVTVSAEDPSITKEYTITVRRQADNTDLSSMKLDGADIPGFDPGILSYSATVPNAVTAVAVTGTAADAQASVSVTGGSNLIVGPNIVTVTVTAEDPSITKDYILQVTREPSSNADLSALSLSSGTLSPAYAPAVTNYTVSVSNHIAGLTVIPTAADSTASIKVNQSAVTSGQASGKITLQVGGNSVEIGVTAQDGTLKTYTIHVTRYAPPSSGGGNSSAPTPSAPSSSGEGNTSSPVPSMPGTQDLNPAETTGTKEEPITAGGDPEDISGHWAQDSIRRAIKAGIASGYPDGSFRPDAQVTRAEFAVMLIKALHLQGYAAQPAFSDRAKIKPWAEQSIAQAVQAGILTGYEDGTFRPDAAVTRAEMAVMVAKALEVSYDTRSATDFEDDDLIPAWAKGAVNALNKLALIGGKSMNEFDPKSGTTRAEAATILLKMQSQIE